jgi:hypothetical protein
MLVMNGVLFSPYRGFESLPLRHFDSNRIGRVTLGPNCAAIRRGIRTVRRSESASGEGARVARVRSTGRRPPIPPSPPDFRTPCGAVPPTRLLEPRGARHIEVGVDFVAQPKLEGEGVAGFRF